MALVKVHVLIGLLVLMASMDLVVSAPVLPSRQGPQLLKRVHIVQWAGDIPIAVLAWRFRLLHEELVLNLPQLDYITIKKSQGLPFSFLALLMQM